MLWVNVGLLAAWLMLNGIGCLSIDAALNLSNVGKNIYAPDPYPIQRFNTRSTDPSRAYLELIRGIRELLTDNQLDPVFGLPRLADRNSVPSTRQFLLLQLFISTEDRSITLAIDTIRLYVVGYRRSNEFHYFSDTAQGVDTLFRDVPHTVLPFDSSYGDLAKEGGNRSVVPLGMNPLEEAISDLQAYNRRELGHAFTVIIQMISEAIRFR